MSEELRAREWRVNPETPSVIITPHGRISINWSHQRAGEPNEYGLAEETAAMIVGMVNASFASSAAGQREGWNAARIAEMINEGGSWRACSGCQEGEDGYVSQRDYPYSKVFRCQPGGGCTECGGIGVIWEGPGYWDGYAEHAIASPSAPEERRDEVAELVFAARAALATLQHARVFIGSRERMHPQGQELYDADIAHLSSALAALTPVPGER